MRWKNVRTRGVLARIFRCSAVLISLLLIAPASRLPAEEAGMGGEAATLLKRSIAAHSGGPARLRLVYRGQGFSPGQSANVEGPFSKHHRDVSLALDEAARTMAMTVSGSIDGDFTFRTQYGFADGKGFSTTYTGEYEELTDFPMAANAFVPHLLLRNVLETAISARVSQEADYDLLTYSSAPGATQTLLFDRKTHLLAAVRRPPIASAFGDQTVETTYDSYRRVGNSTVPGRLLTRTVNPVQGTADVERLLVEASSSGPLAFELEPPPGAVKRTPRSRTFAVEPLGRDVYLLRNASTEGQFSYNILAALFEDHVLVVEAGLNDGTSRKVIEEVERLAPGKPIRMLVQTHHHDDHIGGIRNYVANGTRILTPAGTRRLIERMAAAHSAVAPDALAKAPRLALVEEVAGERVIRDSRNEVRLYDLPTAHSDHMLVVYLPGQRVLYQGDLISAGEIPLNATSRDFLDWLRERRLPVARLAGLHGHTVSGAELDTLLQEGRFAAAPAGSPLLR